MEQIALLGCLIRQEGSVWRSGSTYIVSLTPDGRVFLHAKDMALAGRQAQSPDLWRDPCRAGSLSGRSRQPGISRSRYARQRCRRTRHIVAGTGWGVRCLRPPYPVRLRLRQRLRLGPISGHRSCCSPDSISVSLTWFPSAPKPSITATPAITASDVVDRETLKAFVTEAGNYLLQTQSGRFDRGIQRLLANQACAQGSERTLEARLRLSLHSGHGPPTSSLFHASVSRQVREAGLWCRPFVTS